MQLGAPLFMPARHQHPECVCCLNAPAGRCVLTQVEMARASTVRCAFAAIAHAQETRMSACELCTTAHPWLPPMLCRVALHLDGLPVLPGAQQLSVRSRGFSGL